MIFPNLRGKDNIQNENEIRKLVLIHCLNSTNVFFLLNENIKFYTSERNLQSDSSSSQRSASYTLISPSFGMFGCAALVHLSFGLRGEHVLMNAVSASGN